MSRLILLPFGVFFVCCILQFWYLKKVRDALVDRHPDTFISVEKSSMFPMQGLYRFSRGARHKELNDTLLSRHVKNIKRLMIVAHIAGGAYAISLFTMPLTAPQLSIALADGSYVNECCGRLTLINGRMTVGARNVSYVVEDDKEGPYVLPTSYVGAASRGFVMRRDGQPLKLRLNNEAHPTSIELVDDTSGSIFSFHRFNGS